MIFTLEPLRALEGDCLLLHFGTKEEPLLAVIDGGPSTVYEDALKPRLEEIRRNRGLDRLDVDVAMVSHIDADHIVGVKKLFRELQRAIENNTPNGVRVRVRTLWHNTFNDILRDAIDKYYKTFTATFTASTNGEATPGIVKELSKTLAWNEAFDIGSILAGHADGRALRDSHAVLFDAHQIGPLNSPFGESGKSDLITAELRKTSASVGNLKFKVVGPKQAQIKALQVAFDKYIEKKGLTANSVLAAYADKSIPNLSSIVCLVTSGKRSILFTGDARGDYVLQGLEQAKLLKKKGTLSVDVLKVPHHGSIRNIDADFFKRIVAGTYVFSGNGKHGNPDRETLELLMESRGKEDEYNIVLTYDVEETDAGRRKDFKKRKKTWNAQKHSLAAMFAARKKAGFKFTLSAGEDGKIELGTSKIAF